MVDRRLHGLMVLVVHNQDHQFLLFLFRDSHVVLHRHQIHLHFQVFFFRLLTPRILLAIISMMADYKSYRLMPSREDAASQLLDELETFSSLRCSLHPTHTLSPPASSEVASHSTSGTFFRRH